jgi:polyferredoxin
VRPASFIVVLYVMSLACLVIAFGDRSLGWFVGAIVFFDVAQFARRKATEEQEEPDSGGARGKFIVVAMLIMVAAMYGMYLLSESA